LGGSGERFVVVGLQSDTGYHFAIKVGDEVPNWSGLSNTVYGKTIREEVAPDTTAPSVVTDLAISDSTSNTITLAWTAPGDDGNAGTASQYDIRYSTSVVTEVNWDSAEEVTDAPKPKLGGSGERFVVVGLRSDTEYHFAIKVGDEVPNWSGLSNTVYGKTIRSDTTPPPAPESLTADGSRPSPWKRIPNFIIDWTAPFDESGMAGAWYKLDVGPDRPADERYTTDKPFTITDISEGEHVLYVWLQDGAGNKSPANSATVALRYDPTPPSTPSLSEPHSHGVINDVRPTFDWEDVIDALSGLRHYELLVDDNVDLTSPEYADTTTVSMSTLTGALSPGRYYWQVTAQDGAGNFSRSEKSSFVVDTVGPVVSFIQAGPNPTEGADHVMLIGGISDAGRGESMIVDAEYFVDRAGEDGFGIAMVARDGAWDSPTEDVEVAVYVSSWEVDSTYVLYIHGKDVAGNWGLTDSVSVKITSRLFLATTPSGTVTVSGDSIQFDIECRDDRGNRVEVIPLWGVSPEDLGEIDSDGLFVASRTGTGVVVATVGDMRDTVFVHVLEKPMIVYNYPNPARGDETMFRYCLDGPAHVSIEIYDLAGDFVQELSAEEIARGYGEVRWDLSKIASGVYIYRFSARYAQREIRSPVKKMMVIR